MINRKLTQEIAHHILANLGVLPSEFIKVAETNSILHKQFLLPEKISFQEDERIIENPLFGSQINISSSEFKLLLVDCTKNSQFEYSLLIQLKSLPAFGIYVLTDPDFQESLIGVNVDGKHWIPCTTFLQATFLAGMEQIRDVSSGWKKCQNYQSQYQQLLSFIKFQDQFFGENYEGKEN